MGGTRNEDSNLEHKIISLFFENDNLLPKLQNIWLWKTHKDHSWDNRIVTWFPHSLWPKLLISFLQSSSFSRTIDYVPLLWAGSCSPKGDPGKEQQKEKWPQLWLKCLAMCQCFQIKMFGFHSQSVSFLTTKAEKRQLMSTDLSPGSCLWSNESKHFPPELCLLWWLRVDKNAF